MLLYKILPWAFCLLILPSPRVYLLIRAHYLDGEHWTNHVVNEIIVLARKEKIWTLIGNCKLHQWPSIDALTSLWCALANTPAAAEADSATLLDEWEIVEVQQEEEAKFSGTVGSEQLGDNYTNYCTQLLVQSYLLPHRLVPYYKRLSMHRFFGEESIGKGTQHTWPAETEQQTHLFGRVVSLRGRRRERMTRWLAGGCFMANDIWTPTRGSHQERMEEEEESPSN